jgi:predicted nucleic acid-binding protein
VSSVNHLRVYLDVCCLNRPFDDQAQERIRLESEAILLIFYRIHVGAITWVSSEVVDYEIGLTPDVTRRGRVSCLAQAAGQQILLEEADERRAAEFEALGFRPYDALHLACAERAVVDVFLTTDDKLVRLASRHAARVRVAVRNPLQWLLEVQDQ